MIRDWWDDNRKVFIALACGAGTGVIVGLAVSAKLGRPESRTEVRT